MCSAVAWRSRNSRPSASPRCSADLCRWRRVGPEPGSPRLPEAEVGLELVEHAEVWIESGIERALAEQGRGEGVDGGDLRGLDLAHRAGQAGASELLADSFAEFASGLLGERDGDNSAERDAAPGQLDDPRHQHARLARASSGFQEE